MILIFPLQSLHVGVLFIYRRAHGRMSLAREGAHGRMSLAQWDVHWRNDILPCAGTCALTTFCHAARRYDACAKMADSQIKRHVSTCYLSIE